ncbi:hypothetical protein GBAR_LOCUS10745, partial [Geodia barretti]
RLDRPPSSGGISTRQLVASRNSRCRLARLPNSFGILPFRPKAPRSSSVTRPDASPRATPVQSAIGVSADQ